MSITERAADAKWGLVDAAIRTVKTVLQSRVAPSTSIEILEAFERMRAAPGAKPDEVFQIVEPILSMYKSKPPAVTPFSPGQSRVILEAAPWRLSRMKVHLGRRVRGFESPRCQKIVDSIIHCRSTMDAEFLFREAIATEIVQTRLPVFGEVRPVDDRQPLQELHRETFGAPARLSANGLRLASPIALVRHPHGAIWAVGDPPPSFGDPWNPQGTLFIPFDSSQRSLSLSDPEGLAAFLALARPAINPHTLPHLIHWMMEPWPPGTHMEGIGPTEDPAKCACPDDAHPWFVKWADREEEGVWDKSFEPRALSIVLKLPEGKVVAVTYETAGSVRYADGVPPVAQGGYLVPWES